MLKIGYYSTVGSELRLVSQAYGRIIKEGGLELRSFCGKDWVKDKEREAFLDYLGDLDLLIVSLHGGKDKSPGFDEIFSSLDESVARCVFPSNTATDLEDALEYTSLAREDWQKLVEYFNYSGEENYYNMLAFILARLGQAPIDYREPKALAWEGICYREASYLDSLDDYLALYHRPDWRTVGVIFHRSQWVNNNVDFIDDLISLGEERQLNILPVFTNAIAVERLGNLGAGRTVEKFFMKDGQVIIDVCLNLMMFSNTMNGSFNQDMFEKLNVAVLNGVLSFNEKELWQETYQGLNPLDISINIALPEFDGSLGALALAFSDRNHIDPLTGGRIARYVSSRERIGKTLDLAKNFANLAYIANKDKKVAILFHNYPPKNHSIGTAFGLDSPLAVVSLLGAMKDQGYQLGEVPETGDQLIGQLMEGATNDRNFISQEDLFKRSVAQVDLDQYRLWFNKLSPEVAQAMVEKYGELPGNMFNHGDRLIIPGIIKDNIFIGIQPPRGTLEDADKVHDQDLPMPHHYYAYYEWIREVFQADAVMHIGMHGSLEWLPGKSAGLSQDCYPDIAIGDLPNIYPYIINNPGEGSQAKRRSYACIIDHLIPVMTRADAYEETAELENLLNDHYDAEQLNPAKLKDIEDMIWEKTLEANLDKDLDIGARPQDFSGFLEDLHGYLNELKDTQIRNGLHIFGACPEGERLVEFLVALTRLENGDIASLRRSIGEKLGYDLDYLLDNRGKRNPEGELNAHIIDRIHQLSLDLMEDFYREDFQLGAIGQLLEKHGLEDRKIEEIMTYVGASLVPNLYRTSDEIENSLRALGGEFISPGPSGSPTRGMAHILPTGRNFYSVNPRAIPSPAAWKTGKLLGDNLLDRYRQEEGTYPESIGISIAGSPTMRTKGDDVAEILYLMGVRPVWEKTSSNVAGLEAIPLEDLGRPRIDVTVRITGFFRDAFPNLVELLDQAVKLVGFLDEDLDKNFIKKHIEEDMKEIVAEGMEASLAREEASMRIFGCKPGGYGAGVSNLIASKQWENLEDLGNIYLDWSSYAYGENRYGESKPERLKKRLATMDIAVTNVDHRERGLLDSDDFYSYHGGMIAAVKTFKGGDVKSYIGDSSQIDRVETRTVQEELRREFRARVFNPKWLDSMKKHGYKAAGDMANTINHAFGWDATVDAVDDWIYEDIAKKFLMDEDMASWMEEVNPWAIHEISERLLEAIQRDMWQADETMKQEIMKIYLRTEGDLEGRGDQR